MNTLGDDAALATTAPPAPEPPHPRVPGVWSGLGSVVLYFALQLGISLMVGMVAGFGIAISLAVNAAAHHLKVDQAAIKQAAAQPDVRIAIVLITLVATAAVMLWFIRNRWRELWPIAQPPGFGFTAPARKAYFLLAVVVGIAMAYFGGLLATALAGPHAPKQDISVWAHSVTLGLRIPLALATVCVVPVVEEALFRGVLLTGLMRRMHVAWAVLASGLVFGLVHLPDFKFAWYPIPSLVGFGLLLAWLRLQSRSLWTSITAHATLNAVGAIGWFLASTPHP